MLHQSILIGQRNIYSWFFNPFIFECVVQLTLFSQSILACQRKLQRPWYDFYENSFDIQRNVYKFYV